jgi:hypothetical protein
VTPKFKVGDRIQFDENHWWEIDDNPILLITGIYENGYLLGDRHRSGLKFELAHQYYLLIENGVDLFLQVLN